MNPPATTRFRNWCTAIATAAAIAFAPHASSSGGEALAKVEIHPPFALTGSITVSARGLKQSKPATFDASIGETTFELIAPSGNSFSGTTTNSADGTKSSLVFDASALAGLAAQVQQQLIDSLTGQHTVSVTATQGTGTIKWGPTRAERKLAGKFALILTIDGSKPARLKCALRGSGLGRRVLLLDDGPLDSATTGDQVQPALEKAGHFVVRVNTYSTWDGVSPPLDGMDVVVLCQRFTYDQPLTVAADQALVAWVNAGHGIVRTEWSAYSKYSQAIGSLDDLLPVVSPAANYVREATWKVDPAQKKHPLVRGLPKSFTVKKAGFSIVTAQPGTTVYCANPDGVPCLSSRPAGLGTIVHINHGTYEVGPEVPIAKPILRVFVNAVPFLAP